MPLTHTSSLIPAFPTKIKYIMSLSISFTPRPTTTPFNPLLLLPPPPISPLNSIKFSKSPTHICCTTTTTTNLEPDPPKIAHYDFDESSSSSTDSPWEGAVVYKRNSFVTHVEYCTTLERLGLGKLSTDVSKARASVMGLRVSKAVKDYPLGTPVLVSLDVCKRKNKLRLDGIIRTVLTLGCNRCGGPAAECVFSNFTLLLSEDAIEEGDVINMGVLFGESKQNSSTVTGEDSDDDDDALIDMDDRLYFPAEQNQIDISKNIRDLVHVEITINAVCDPNCKGLCLRCGANLNTSKCRCPKQTEETNFGPLRNLKDKMRKK